MDGMRNPKIFRERVKIENRISRDFDERWGWLIEEYAQQNKDLHKVHSSLEEAKELPEKSGLKPYPPTTTGMIGWLSTKPEFKLEIYGSDVPKAKPLPDIYAITRLPNPLSDGLEYCD